ncbi:ATP-binding protein [Paenibacillus hunanensis]|uniref:ATP-binding protein n=1 Tax=Paenibacillus hunanensis TaxID=539262 RepID=UPI002A69CD91|nr:ATP-binding protein [Paenibacillus hunanensis]WPP43268.1 ATP-binding protein [Paenibacillus hunanensis]
MNNSNVNGYKMIYYLEKLLREYIVYYLEDFESLDSHYYNKWKDNAYLNLNKDAESLEVVVKFAHLGELIDCIGSKKFNEIKRNEVKNLNIKILTAHRNNIMHSRELNTEQESSVSDLCEKVIYSLKDSNFETKWSQFIQNDIDQFTIPTLYLEYPVGKNFNNLIGRQDELKDFKEYIKAPTPVTVIGHGGVGKTALVLQLIEDLMSSPDKEFEYIYFMSFKNSVFDKGEVRRFEKVINDHKGLITKLAFLMEINSSCSFEDLEEKVWEKVFSQKTLLVLDNLETEIVKTNLFEFSNIAQKFIKNFNKPSRLIMTSRYGLGDRENKFPLHQFKLNKTQELTKRYMNGIALKNRELVKDDWEWIQAYTQGNPGLIIALCHTLSSTNKKTLDLRLEYESEYTKESTELHSQLDEFLGFCFENTIESMEVESQKFLSCLCYICSETHITEINEELLSFLREELKNQKFSERYTKASNFINIGFLQPVPNSNRYLANELVIDYMNGNYSNTDAVFNVFKLRAVQWFKDIKGITTLMNEIKFEEEVGLEQLTSQLYLSKYKNTNNIEFLLRSFHCYSTLDSLYEFYSKADDIKVINHFNLLDKVSSNLKNQLYFKKQNLIVGTIISALLEINKKILRREITHLRQQELYDYFIQLSSKVAVLQYKKIDGRTRRQICILLINLKRLNLAEEYLLENDEMITIKFDIYSKQVMELVHQNPNKCEEYILKCDDILSRFSRSIGNKKIKQYLIYSARFYIKANPQKVLTLLKNFEYEVGDIQNYIFHLESLLLRAKATLFIKGDLVLGKEFLDEFIRLKNTKEYSELFPGKKEKLNKDFEIIQNKFKREKRNL